MTKKHAKLPRMQRVNAVTNTVIQINRQLNQHYASLKYYPRHVAQQSTLLYSAA